MIPSEKVNDFPTQLISLVAEIKGMIESMHETREKIDCIDAWCERRTLKDYQLH